MVGLFAFVAYDKAVLSYCVSLESIFFGLVNQDYILHDEVLQIIGISLFEYTINQYMPNTYNASMINILRRGVIGVRQVGYV